MKGSVYHSQLTIYHLQFPVVNGDQGSVNEGIGLPFTIDNLPFTISCGERGLGIGLPFIIDNSPFTIALYAREEGLYDDWWCGI